MSEIKVFNGYDMTSQSSHIHDGTVIAIRDLLPGNWPNFKKNKILCPLIHFAEIRPIEVKFEGC